MTHLYNFLFIFTEYTAVTFIILAILLLLLFRFCFKSRWIANSIQAFIFVVMLFTLLSQNRSFELRNRPYLKIEPFIMRVTDRSRLIAGSNMLEPQLKCKTVIKNYGTVPAYVKEVVIKVSNSKDFANPIPIGAFSEDKTWENFDIFPGEDNSRDFKATFYLNFDHILELLGVDLRDGIDVTAIEKRGRGWDDLIPSPEFEKQQNKFDYDYYVIIQVEYYILGDRCRSRPYYYWVQYHINKVEPEFIKSGIKKLYQRP